MFFMKSRETIVFFSLTETNPSKMSQVTFNLNDQNMTLGCSADKTSGESMEAVKINFSMGNIPTGKLI